jgi:hypothetical protein
MAKLTIKKRDSLPEGKFALPAQRKYPIPDKAHAANAKARAEQQLEKGKISKPTRNRIDAAANRVLDEGAKSKSKAKTKPKGAR